MSNTVAAFSKLRRGIDELDKRASHSAFGRYFGLQAENSEGTGQSGTLLGEFRAGTTTFATMVYIIAVNASVISQTGGPCPCNLENRIDCDSIDSYKACKEAVRYDLITATAAITGLASFAFGLITNLPVALAPGMGLNAYFAFQVVGVNGSGRIPYAVALTAVFVEGLIFIFLAITGMRQWLVKLIPATIKTGTGVGIGLFLAEIGLSYNGGIGAITGGWKETPLALAGCPVEMLDPSTRMCDGGIMTSPKMWIAIVAGGIFTAYMIAFKVKYAFVIGIALVSILSWPRNTSVTYFPDTDEGNQRFEYFKRIVSLHSIEKTLNALDWGITNDSTQFVLALFTFLYVDIIDATATLYSMVRFAGRVDPENGDFPRSTLAYCCDAICISISALLGCSPVTAFIESGAGIAEGGRTGLTAMVTGTWFLLSIFFVPIFASIPPWATGSTLILVGCTMVRQLTAINWHYIGDLIPSLTVMMFIPFSYSVAYGLIAGMFTYTILNGLIAITLWISRGKLEPQGYNNKEYWSWRGYGTKPWFVRAMRKKGWIGKPAAESGQWVNESEDGETFFHKTSYLESLNQSNVQTTITIPMQALNRSRGNP